MSDQSVNNFAKHLIIMFIRYFADFDNPFLYENGKK